MTLSLIESLSNWVRIPDWHPKIVLQAATKASASASSFLMKSVCSEEGPRDFKASLNFDSNFRYRCPRPSSPDNISGIFSTEQTISFSQSSPFPPIRDFTGSTASRSAAAISPWPWDSADDSCCVADCFRAASDCNLDFTSSFLMSNQGLICMVKVAQTSSNNLSSMVPMWSKMAEATLPANSLKLFLSYPKQALMQKQQCRIHWDSHCHCHFQSRKHWSKQTRNHLIAKVVMCVLVLDP